LFCIFFQSGEELHITLWGDSARDFDELALHNLPSPVIIAFAGFRVTEFKGNFNFHLIFFLKIIFLKDFYCHSDPTNSPFILLQKTLLFTRKTKS
jgi:hypothetical protein